METKGIPAVVVGGDLRQVYAANELQRRGYAVAAVGFGQNLPFEEGIQVTNSLEVLNRADLALFPLGMSCGENLNTPLYEGVLSLSTCLKALSPTCAVFGGNLTMEERKQAEYLGLKLSDFFREEDLTVANAVLTAEAALEIAMRELPVSLWQSRCLICGYGRIGRALASRLTGFGARVTAAARSPEQRSWAQAEGVRAVDFGCLPSILGYQQVIFNTVPNRILGLEEIRQTAPDVLLIELASKPYGIDLEAAQTLGRKGILASGLPGKHSPKSAGILIAKTVDQLYRREEK